MLDGDCLSAAPPRAAFSSDRGKIFESSGIFILTGPLKVTPARTSVGIVIFEAGAPLKGDLPGIMEIPLIMLPSIPRPAMPLRRP